MFNRSLESSKFPSLWKFGKVTALFKSGDRCDSGNYRPITILPTVSKVLEKVVHHQVYKYLMDEKILSPVQFGFRPNLSTEVALIHFTDSILDNMDKGAVTGAIFLDLSKAFDTVNHSILFSKLSKAGFNDATVTWFNSYLYQRTQVTRVDNATSSAKYVSVGVPQGSVLGPLLFILYVNDLPSYIKKCKVTMYADDTVLYFSSSTLSELEENLNADLKILCRYLNDNLLTLNAEKSKFIIFGSTRKLNSFREFSLEINALSWNVETPSNTSALNLIKICLGRTRLMPLVRKSANDLEFCIVLSICCLCMVVWRYITVSFYRYLIMQILCGGTRTIKS